MGWFGGDSSEDQEDYGHLDEQSESRFASLKKYIPGRLNITRIAFSTFIVCGFLLALFIRDGMMGIMNVSWAQLACKKYTSIFKASCSGKYPVYRISFSMATFYFLFAFLASRLFPVGDKVRLYIQYKWFLLKIPVFLVLLVVPFLIPDSFFYYYAWLALFMSGLFLVIQIILLIDFAFDWAYSWRSPENESNNIWDYLMVVCAFILILIAIALVVLTIVFFGSGPTCHLNRFFSLFTVGVSIVVIVLCVMRGKGILPAAVVVCFAAFTLWSAVLSDPNTKCNRLTTVLSGGSVKHNKASEIVTTIFGVLIAAFSLVRCTVTTGQSFSSFFKLSEDEQTEEDEEKTEEQINRFECSELFYSHLVFMFGSFYTAMVLVSWDIVSQGEGAKYQTEVSIAAVWVKIVSQWFTFAVFIWCLLAPKILGRCRSFRDDEDSY